jgi:hypothetical protein
MISYTDKPVITQHRVSPTMFINIHEDRIVTYRYNVNKDEGMQFEFGLLCECGEHWRVIFDRYIKSHDLKIVKVDDPDYYGERITTL